MYIKQIANTLRTFGECSLNTHEIECETPRQFPTFTTKLVANTPPIPHVHHEIGCETLRQFPTSTTKLVVKHPANSPRSPRNWLRTLRQFPTSTTKLEAKHSVRRRGPIHRARILTLPIAHIRIAKFAFPHYQIRVYSLSNMHIHIINYVFSSHHAHIFALPYQYIRFLLSIILNIKQPNTAYIYT